MPTTDHDGGSVEVWVPDLKRPGAYLVNLELARGSDGVVLYRATPVPLPEEEERDVRAGREAPRPVR